MAVLQAAWLRPAALGLAALVFALWCVRYFRAMAWKRGTLEWIARFDRRRMTKHILIKFRKNMKNLKYNMRAIVLKSWMWKEK